MLDQAFKTRPNRRMLTVTGAFHDSHMRRAHDGVQAFSGGTIVSRDLYVGIDHWRYAAR